MYSDRVSGTQPPQQWQIQLPKCYVGLQLCHISSFSTGLFLLADWEMMVGHGTDSNASPAGSRYVLCVCKTELLHWSCSVIAGWPLSLKHAFLFLWAYLPWWERQRGSRPVLFILLHVWITSKHSHGSFWGHRSLPRADHWQCTVQQPVLGSSRSSFVPFDRQESSPARGWAHETLLTQPGLLQEELQPLEFFTFNPPHAFHTWDICSKIERCCFFSPFLERYLCISSLFCFFISSAGQPLLEDWL